MSDEIFDEEKVEGVDKRRESREVMGEKKRDITGDKVVGSMSRMVNKLDDFTIGPDGTIVLSQEDQLKMMDADSQIAAALRSQGLDEKQIAQFASDLSEMENLMKSKNYDEVFGKMWNKIYGGDLEKVDQEKMADLKKYYRESGYSFVYLTHILSDLKTFENGPNKKNTVGPGFDNDKYWEKYNPKNFQRVFDSIKGLLGDTKSGDKYDNSGKLLQFWTIGDFEYKYQQVVSSGMGKYLNLAFPSLNGFDEREMDALKDMKERLYDYGKIIIKQKQVDGKMRQNEKEQFKENLKNFFNDIGKNRSVTLPEGKGDFYETVDKYKRH